MIPPKPKEIADNCNEAVIFRKLEKGLGEDFYVFHSVKELEISKSDELFEREIDFVIAHKDYGVLCIEAKGGKNISYSNRTWYYSSGNVMDHEGPYHQIATAKRTIREKIKNNNNDKVRDLYNKCRFFHAVMFADMSKHDFDRLAGLPEECDSKITICTEDIISIEKKVKEIFSYKLSWEKYNTSETKMNDFDFKLLLDAVLCPQFKLIPTARSKNALIAVNMNQMLHEQYLILDFLDEQPTAVINGAAGTGKTMLAVHKARMHSKKGEKVLLLCYNKLLCEHLIEEYTKSDDPEFNDLHKNIDFMTISKLAKKKTGNYKDFDGLLEWLLYCAEKTKELGYQHIIVDEGQDFGLVDAELTDGAEDMGKASDNCSIVDALQDAALANDGTFYLFYDKYQMIQGKDDDEYSLPDCIKNSDCRLTLHKNCRNTLEIARTSVTPLRDQKNRVIKTSSACSWDKPYKPVMHLVKDTDNAITALNQIVDKLVFDGISDIVLITQQTIKSTCIIDKLYGNEEQAFYKYDGKEYMVTTCKKFKGLEADAVIMIDLNKESFAGKRGNAFYVGTSRAKLRLELVCQISKEDYVEVVQRLDPNAPTKKNLDRMRNILGNVFGADIEMH